LRIPEEEEEAGRFSCLPIETDGKVIDIAAGEDFFMLINENKVCDFGAKLRLEAVKSHSIFVPPIYHHSSYHGHT
jgi:hypothetical protein